MQFSSTTKIPSKENLALYLLNEGDIPTGLLSDNEMAYAKKSLKNIDGKWIEINQYARRVFIRKHATNAKNAKEAARKAGSDLVKTLNAHKETQVTAHGGELEWPLAEGMYLGNYQFLRYFSAKNRKENTIQKVGLLNTSKTQIDELNALCRAVIFSRDLVNTPVWDLTAPQLGQKAIEAGKKHGFKVEVFDKKKIESLKMGGLLAVNKGSLDPPAFIIMEHNPSNATNKKPVVLVGKGVVYDTGGLSLKPSTSMDTMKSDMGGSAAVLGTMCAIAEAELPVHVIGLVPATDNRPGGNAVTPGDVITMMNGLTVEVMNTDAEGRLILADALHYAKKYKPELVIDLATLTGAAAMALGHFGIVGMGTAPDQSFQKLAASGEEVYERVVKFPFWEEYDELLKSPIADLKNIGTREGGAITAGKFLANFTDYPYIHLDIAGPAFIAKDEGYLTKGATGVGVRLLYNFLKNY